MPTMQLNGAEIYYEIEGDGPPFVLVHGSWGNHESWRMVANELVGRFTVVTYDRRGHSGSERRPGPVTRRTHEDDLAALIEMADVGPVHLAGYSYGGLTGLGLAARRPELLRSVSVHEPPVASVAPDGELGEIVAAQIAKMRELAAEIGTGDVEMATRRFFEEVVLGPGGWELLPDRLQEIFLENAPAYVADMGDPAFAELDVAAVERFGGRVAVTRGDVSPAWLPMVTDRLAEVLPSAHRKTFAGAGHGVHTTHPVEYAAFIAGFAAQADDAALDAARV